MELLDEMKSQLWSALSEIERQKRVTLSSSIHWRGNTNMPIKKENKRVSITLDPLHEEKLQQIMNHTKKNKKRLLEMWIDQYFMAFGHEMKNRS